MSSAAVSYALGPDQYVALRLNFTGPSDISVEDSFYSCAGQGASGRPVSEIVDWDIMDGKPEIADYGNGLSYWYAGDNADMTNVSRHSPLYEAQAAGQRLQSPGYQAWGSCPGASGSNDYGWPLTGNHTLVSIQLCACAYGYFSFNASWTTGLASWDVVVGNATALTLDDFPNGAHAAVFPADVDAGGLLSYHFTPTTDVVGYFDPTYYGSDISQWSCIHASEHCPRGAFGFPDVYSHGSDDWWFNVTADAGTAGEWYALDLIQLPDASYLNLASDTSLPAIGGVQVAAPVDSEQTHLGYYRLPPQDSLNLGSACRDPSADVVSYAVASTDSTIAARIDLANLTGDLSCAGATEPAMGLCASVPFYCNANAVYKTWGVTLRPTDPAANFSQIAFAVSETNGVPSGGGWPPPNGMPSYGAWMEFRNGTWASIGARTFVTGSSIEWTSTPVAGYTLYGGKCPPAPLCNSTYDLRGMQFNVTAHALTLYDPAGSGFPPVWSSDSAPTIQFVL